MKHIACISMATAVLALGACGNGPAADNANREIPENHSAGGGSDPPARTDPRDAFGPEEAMAGIYVTRFEHADFNGCWLSMTSEAAAEFRRRIPAEGADSPQHGGTYQLRILGRHSIDSASGPPSYGHMGGWRCEIRVTRIISAQAVGQQTAPGAGGTDHPGKNGSDSPHGLGAGHDRARLEDQRRQMGQ